MVLRRETILKKVIFLWLLAVLFLQCGKDSQKTANEIKNVTGISWQLMGLQKTNDPSINPIPTNWYLQLNNDRSFAFTLHNTTSTGTYSWVQSDSMNAKVSFTIQTWNSSVADTQYTNRLNVILLSVDSCRYLRPPYPPPLPFFMSPPEMGLKFYGDAGYFDVFKF